MKAKEQPQTIESHVTSLELSKKLKELGVKQESQFGWVQDYREEEQAVLEYLPAASWGSVILPAYLASELWEMLPPFIRVQKHYGEQIV